MYAPEVVGGPQRAGKALKDKGLTAQAEQTAWGSRGEKRLPTKSRGEGEMQGTGQTRLKTSCWKPSF